MKIIPRIGRVLVVLSAVVIAAALSVNAAINVVEHRRTMEFYDTATTGLAGEVRDDVEVTSFVYDTSAHVTGEPGEEVTVNLGTGVWEVLGGGSDDDLNTQTRLTSDIGSTVATWTGFKNILSVLPADDFEGMGQSLGPHGGSVMLEGPMTLTVSGDQPWMVDFRRVVCPGDYEPF